MNGRPHRIACQLALIALLLKAILPTVTAALERQDPPGNLAGMQLCTPGGLVSPGAQGGDAPPGEGTSSPAAHCPWCPSQTSPVVLPEPTVRFTTVVVPESWCAPRETAAPYSPVLWRARRARAPPESA